MTDRRGPARLPSRAARFPLPLTPRKPLATAKKSRPASAVKGSETLGGRLHKAGLVGERATRSSQPFTRVHRASQ